MKLTATLLAVSLASSTIATPLGNRAIFRKHTGVPAANARRYILQSRMDAPPACIGKASTTSNSTVLPDLSNSTITNPAATGVPPNSTSIDDTVDDTDAVGNSTDTSSTDPSGDVPTDNSTAPDTSNSADTNSRRRRGLINTTSTTAATLDIVNLAFEWQSLCLVSGADVFVDGSPCVELAGVHGINALLADADPCEQQKFADAIITFAKSSGAVNKDDLIAFAIKYRHHTRTAVDILGVIPSSLYCQQAPVNPELSGIFNTQPDGANPGLFGSPNEPMVPFGSEGTCPFGTTAEVSSCSCIPDSTNGTDTSASSDCSTDNSTAIDPSATASTVGPSITDPSVTLSANDTSATLSASAQSSTFSASDSDVTFSTSNPSPSLSTADSTTTDSVTPTLDPTATDGAVSDAPFSTSSAASVTNAGTSSATGDAFAPPTATSSSPDISGKGTDSNGRRRK